MQRLIVTGANGAGKSHLAAQLAAARREVPVISLDAVKLTRNWKQRPKSEIETELLRIVQTDSWILGAEFAPLCDQACRWRHVVRPFRMGESLAFGRTAIAQHRENSFRTSPGQCRLAMGAIPVRNSQPAKSGQVSRVHLHATRRWRGTTRLAYSNQSRRSVCY